MGWRAHTLDCSDLAGEGRAWPAPCRCGVAQVAIDVLRNAGTPLHAKEIAERVLASGRAALKGKTPEATISALLAVGSKPSGPFTRVDKGTYTLAETTGPTTAKAVPAPKPATTKRASRGKSPAGRKSAARTGTKRAAAKRAR